jgi:SAM-dependent methyltransferase
LRQPEQFPSEPGCNDYVCCVRDVNMQELHYDEGVDYWTGSPHLVHPALRDQLTSILRATLRSVAAAGLPLDVLEAGAGHGGYTEVALAAGASVTAVDMSGPSLAELSRRYGTNERLTAVHSEDGSLGGLDQQYAVILLVSVLHHIPDYVAYLGEALAHLRPGGTVLSLQDPLFYPRVGARVRALDRGSYLMWRVRQGRIATGVATTVRQARGAYDDSKPGDSVEYHVVRQGVDEQAIVEALAPHFDDVEVIRYWSNQLASAQALGTKLKVANTFGIKASGYRPDR